MAEEVKVAGILVIRFVRVGPASCDFEKAVVSEKAVETKPNVCAV